MDLKFIGRGAAFNTKEGNTNAYFIEGDRLFLIDCGEMAFSKLQALGVLAGVKEVYVVVSHTHCDHAGSLGSLGLYCQFILRTKLKIIVPTVKNPEDVPYIESLRTLMTIFGNTENAYEFVNEEEVDGVFEAFSSVRYELTKHDHMITGYSFTFETPEGGVFYSADTSVTDNLMNFLNTHDVIDKVYMEATDLDVPDDIHLNIDRMIEALAPAMTDELRSKIYMMHLRGDSVIDRIHEAGFGIVETV